MTVVRAHKSMIKTVMFISCDVLQMIGIKMIVFKMSRFMQEALLSSVRYGTRKTFAAPYRPCTV